MEGLFTSLTLQRRRRPPRCLWQSHWPGRSPGRRGHCRQKACLHCSGSALLLSGPPGPPLSSAGRSDTENGYWVIIWGSWRSLTTTSLCSEGGQHAGHRRGPSGNMPPKYTWVHVIWVLWVPMASLRLFPSIWARRSPHFIKNNGIKLPPDIVKFHFCLCLHSMWKGKHEPLTKP